jgi:hypothetical protein
MYHTPDNKAKTKVERSGCKLVKCAHTSRVSITIKTV